MLPRREPGYVSGKARELPGALSISWLTLLPSVRTLKQHDTTSSTPSKTSTVNAVRHKHKQIPKMQVSILPTQDKLHTGKPEPTAPTPPPLIRNKSSKSTRFRIAPIDTDINPNSDSNTSTHTQASFSSPSAYHSSGLCEPGKSSPRHGQMSALATPLTPCLKETGYAPATLELAAVTPLPSLPIPAGEGLVERVDYFDLGDHTLELGGLGVDVEDVGGDAEMGVRMHDHGTSFPGSQPRQESNNSDESRCKRKLIQPVPYDTGLHPLHTPLASHLSMLHPNTPREVIHFIATRLLSTEYPLGYASPSPVSAHSTRASSLGTVAIAGDEQGKSGGEKEGEGEEREQAEPPLSPKEEAAAKGWTWSPIWTSEQDVQRAGVALDASKEMREDCQYERGREEDERMEWMYGVARRGWGLVQARMEREGGE